MTKILVIDDEPSIINLVSAYLKPEGYEVYTAADGNAGLKAARAFKPDLIILDLMLPGMDGIELLSILRRESDVYVIMLTARTDETDKIVGLSVGADDYVTKPFSPRELVLRVRNLLGRRPAMEHAGALLQVGRIGVDLSRHQVTVDGKVVELTATEFKLITVLAQRRGRVQSREQLLRDVWEYDAEIDTRTVDTHVRRLREKLGTAAEALDTVRGVGYRFRDDSKPRQPA